MITPVFAASGALGISSIFNDSAGHSSFHVGIIRDVALGLEGKHHTIKTGWRRGPSRWTKEMMRGRKRLMTGWCGKLPLRFKLIWAYSTGNSRIQFNAFVQILILRLAECFVMFFIAAAMFLSVGRSVSKCALWQITDRQILHIVFWWCHGI